jgi:hypothetical protein
MVDDAFGLAMEDGADLEVALELAKGFFDFEKVFVVALDLCGIGAVDGEVGVEEIPFFHEVLPHQIRAAARSFPSR